MIYREAIPADIPQIQVIRNSVKENILSDPEFVSDADCEEFLSRRGKGWVCEINKQVVGFAIVDLRQDNIWALFLHPNSEKQGIGTKLHSLMLDWYFSTGKQKAWLGTAPNTRAEKFYRKAGWTEMGLHARNEIKFEMTREDWERSKNQDLRRF